MRRNSAEIGPAGTLPLTWRRALSAALVLVQRDNGDRTNRKHARLKYTIDDRSIEWFRAEVEARLGYKLEAAKPGETPKGMAFRMPSPGPPAISPVGPTVRKRRTVEETDR